MPDKTKAQLQAELDQLRNALGVTQEEDVVASAQALKVQAEQAIPGPCWTEYRQVVSHRGPVGFKWPPDGDAATDYFTVGVEPTTLPREVADWAANTFPYVERAPEAEPEPTPVDESGGEQAEES